MLTEISGVAHGGFGPKVKTRWEKDKAQVATDDSRDRQQWDQSARYSFQFKRATRVFLQVLKFLYKADSRNGSELKKKRETTVARNFLESPRESFF